MFGFSSYSEAPYSTLSASQSSCNLTIGATEGQDTAQFFCKSFFSDWFRRLRRIRIGR